MKRSRPSTFFPRLARWYVAALPIAPRPTMMTSNAEAMLFIRESARICANLVLRGDSRYSRMNLLQIRCPRRADLLIFVHANFYRFPTAAPAAHGTGAEQRRAVRPRSHVAPSGRPPRPCLHQNDGGDQNHAAPGFPDKKPDDVPSQRHRQRGHGILLREPHRTG